MEDTRMLSLLKKLFGGKAEETKVEVPYKVETPAPVVEAPKAEEPAPVVEAPKAEEPKKKPAGRKPAGAKKAPAKRAPKK